ncbi:hypothetical protein BV911_09585 [Pseudoruegeria sp. SK021]|nr:hypothetical protein BV911_09585 [Pseudoruegeria sp. SK021]
MASLLCLAGLSACGFQPVYAPGGTGRALTGTVSVDSPDTSYAFSLAQQLEIIFGPPVTPRYRLAFRVTTRSDRVAITAEQDTNRYNLIGQANYTLTDLSSDKVLRSGNVDSFVGYSASGTTVATLAAERDGYERLMTILADKIGSELLSAPLEPAQ